MLRTGLAARVTMIVIIALIAVWLGAIANFYRSATWESRNARPSAAQVAAITELLEQTRSEQRALVATAVGSGTLQVRLEDRPTDGLEPALDHVAERSVFDAYAPALGDRRFTVLDVPVSTRRIAMTTAARKALEFRISLNTGETLIIDTRSPIAVTPFGLPVGFGAGLFGTLVALLALIIMNREMRPLSQLARAVERMDLTATPVPLPRARTSAPEIRALITAFDRLQTRLSRLLRARMAMLGGISHDVRTFATRLRLRVDLIPEGNERNRAISDIDDMIRLLDDALLASRAGANELAEELLDFEEIVRSEVDDRKAAGAGISLRVDQNSEQAMILGDRLALRRIVSNLIDNALKYGRRADIEVSADPANVFVRVEDDGPGIPQDFREILLEPFVRVEASRNRDTGGAGLGLAIVQNLVEAHGGRVEIGEAALGGARVTVRLPLFIPG